MKKFILSVVAIVGFSVTVFALPVNECKTDVYFGNGVWNTEKSADISRQELDNIIKDEIIKGDPALQAKYEKVKLAYNWSADKNYDLVETFYQLRQEGQLSQWLFYQLLDALETRTLSDASGEDMRTIRDKLIEAIGSVEQYNVDEILKKYYEESFQYSHRVLLVSHSQGNLFANRVYDSIDPTDYKAYFANVQVASPASSVHASHGNYITGWVDPIINPIPGSMESNADLDGFGGHAFVEAYLDSSDAYAKIVNAIKTQLNVLDTADSQWLKDQEVDKDTCDYRITVKHRFDSSLEIGENVYPFAANQKLYPAKNQQSGETEYVKASYGGTVFTNDWEEKQENECWMIDNAEKEKITAGIPDYECVIYVEMQYYSGMLKGFFKDERVDCWNSLNHNMDTVYLLNSNYEGDRISTEAMQTILLNDHDSLEILRDQYLQDKIAQQGEGYSYTLEYAVEPFCEIRGETEGFAYVVCTSWKDLLFEAN